MGGEPRVGNVELVRTAFDAFKRRDFGTLVGIMDPEVEFFAPTALLANEGRCYRGHPGIGRYLHDVDLLWARLEPVPETFRDAGNHVVALGRVLATARDGLELDSPAAWVWQIRSGKLVWGCVYADPGPNLLGLTFQGAEPEHVEPVSARFAGEPAA
jgi:ketosteroid isomerase-like protein